MALLWVAPTRGAEGAGAAQTRPAEDVAEIVAQLASADALVRARAAERVEQTGAAARAALVAAVNAEDLALRRAATPLLLRLPFDRPQDPEPVRALLKDYGAADAATRRGVVAKLRVDAPQAAPGVLLRLIREDPSEDVRWAVVSQFRFMGRAALPPEAAPTSAGLVRRAPNVALAAFAWGARNPALSTALNESALEMEARQPTSDTDIVLTYADLAAQYVTATRFDDAAAVHRRAHARAPTVLMIHRGDETSHVQLLFLLHALHGPLRGFEEDLSANARDLARPALRYCVGRAYERLGRRLVADAWYLAAWAGTPPVSKAHADAGQVLMRLGMAGQAERHYLAALSAATEADGLEAVNARLQLALIAIGRGQDFAAAERLRAILESPNASDMNFSFAGRGKVRRGPAARAALEAEMHWRYLRAAKAKGNANSVAAHAKELARLAPPDAEVALDVVPELKKAGRVEEAAKVFAAAYDAAKADLAARPTDPRRMNAVAWLCARCGERFDEARKLADAALALEPDNAGYLDTAAEASFGLGRVDEAVKLEARAVELNPGDEFLEGQLKRFREGKK